MHRVAHLHSQSRNLTNILVHRKAAESFRYLYVYKLVFLIVQKNYLYYSLLNECTHVVEMSLPGEKVSLFLS